MSWKEAAGIYSVMENRANASDKSTYEIAKGGGIYGWGERDKINSDGASQTKVQNAYRGLIAGISESKDYSGGGFYWQGIDFHKHYDGMHAYESFYKVGFKFTSTTHDIWKLGNQQSGKSGWDYKYQSTGVEGKTTFMKLTNEWIKANGYTKSW
ncbi:hypothetical protein D3C72_1245020 [compost metagenome]